MPFSRDFLEKLIVFFYLLNGPVADATEAPQFAGLLCNTVMKMVRFYLLFHFNGALVE
jgi:hypothetical protein